MRSNCFRSWLVVVSALQIAGRSRDNSVIAVRSSGVRLPFRITFRLSKGTLQFCHALQLFVPPPLQLRRYQTVRRVDSIVLPLSQPRLVSRLFQLQLTLPTLADESCSI